MIAGVAVVMAVFDAATDGAVRVEALLADGDRLVPGEPALCVQGPARAMLTAERTALNLLNLSNDSPERIYVLLDETQREPGLRAPEGVEVFYGPRPDPAEIAWFEGRLPCTNAARTLNDCASRYVDVEELTHAIHNGLRAGLFTEDEIAPALAYTHHIEEEAS